MNALVLSFASESDLRVAVSLIGRIKGGDKSHKIPGQAIAMLAKCIAYKPAGSLVIDQSSDAMVGACNDPARQGSE